MHIYLDQNIWIDLAKIHHGKDKRPESARLLSLIQKKLESGDIVLPLSRIHYIETSTIANAGRRERLGRVMFDYSKGVTLASYKSIVLYELDCALSKIFKHVKPRNFKLFGNGIKHAYGDALEFKYPSMMDPNWIERAALTGEEIENLVNKNIHPANKEDLKVEDEAQGSALGSIGLKPKIVH